MTTVSEHAELNEHLNAYLDGALDQATLRRLERHLRSCELCRADLDQLRLTRDALRALPALRAPRPFTIPVAPVPAAVRPASPWLAWAWRLGSFGAAACLLLAVVTSFAAAPGPASTALSEGAAPGAPLPRSAALADRDSAQRAGPAQRQQNPQSEPAAVPPAASPAAPEPPPAPAAAPGGAGGGLAGSGRGAASPPAGFAPGPSDAQVKTAGPPPSAPGATPWLAMAAILGAGSAALFVVDRRSRVS
jgi:anti-sigma factor RsiW